MMFSAAGKIAWKVWSCLALIQLQRNLSRLTGKDRDADTVKQGTETLNDTALCG